MNEYLVRDKATGEVFKVDETTKYAVSSHCQPVLVRTDNEELVDPLGVEALEPTDEEWRDLADRLGLK